VKFTVEQVLKTQRASRGSRESRGITLLFL